MSETQSGSGVTVSPMGVVWAIVVLFGISVAAVVLVSLFLHDEAATVIAAVLSQMVTVIAVIANLRVTAQVQTDTKDLRNGLLDAKVRAGVADVLPDHLVDPDYKQTGQYARDDERRAGEH